MAVSEQIFSVGEYVKLVNDKLDALYVKVLGEVTEVKQAASGHVYFTLKDQKAQAVIPCAIWKRRYETQGVEIKEGMELVVTGSANLYAPAGRLSFVATIIELYGEGKLKEQYDKLKRKLESEGLFEPAKKRPVPDYIHNIGVITSVKDGAVIGDFQSNIGKFGFNVLLMNSRVEGQEAVVDLLSSIRTFQTIHQQIDVLVIIRGGGSLESLQPFNNEKIARTIANFPVPVLVGVGHDKDQPLAAMVADYAASTSSIVAKAIAYSWEQASNRIELAHSQIEGKMRQNLADINRSISKSQYKIHQFATKFTILFRSLESKVNLQIASALATTRQAHEGIEGQGRLLKQIFKNAIQSVINLVDGDEQIIIARDPARALDIGYSISMVKGVVLKTVAQVQAGGTISTVLKDGSLGSTINNINPN